MHDRGQRIIGRHYNVGRLILSARLGDDALHFDDAVVRVDHGVTTSCLGRDFDEIAEDAVAERAMGNFAQALVLIGWHSDDVEDQRPLGLRAHHAVYCREFADAIGCRQHGRAPDARIAVGGVRRIQFVGTADPLHFRATVNRVADRKHIIAGNAKAVFDPFCRKSIDDVIGDAHRLYCSCRRVGLSTWLIHGVLLFVLLTSSNGRSLRPAAEYCERTRSRLERKRQFLERNGAPAPLKAQHCRRSVRKWVWNTRVMRA